METFKPTTPSELEATVAWALAQPEVAFEILGRGSKRALGRSVSASHRLDLSAFAGIQSYEPNEMVVSVGAATPLLEVEDLLEEQGQHFSFEPPDFGPLFGIADNEGTVGGAVACNLAGPRRFQQGAVRDHLLGFKGVNGLGESFRSGGRVVKNVTGFDLSKLMTGSFGTLAVLTDLTVRVHPQPKSSETLIVRNLDWQQAGAAMTTALAQTTSVTGAAYIPKETASSSFVSQIRSERDGFVALRLESQGRRLIDTFNTVANALKDTGQVDRLDMDDAKVLWRDIRDARFFVGKPHQVWQVHTQPSVGPDIATEILEQIDGLAYLDWGGGLVWLALQPSPDASQGVVRRATKRVGAQATLIRASEEIRRIVDVFEPLSPALMHLEERLRMSFDPRRILNPGRKRLPATLEGGDSE